MLHLIELANYGLHEPLGLLLFGQRHPTAHHAAQHGYFQVAVLFDIFPTPTAQLSDDQWRDWIREQARMFCPLMKWIDTAHVAISAEWQAAVHFLTEPTDTADDRGRSAIASEQSAPSSITINDRIKTEWQRIWR